jgi:hypothetical protein
MALLTTALRSSLGRLARRAAPGLAALLLLPAAAQAQGGVEYAVKANYLYKFGPFVAWPPRAFATPASPFVVCVVGADPFGAALDEAVRGQTVNGRAVRVRRLAAVSAGDGCQVAYIGRSSAQSAGEALRLLQGAPVLTVTDERSGIDGGVVHFVLRDGRVRFTLDLAAARAAGLALSSKLITLAVAVVGGAA